MISTTDLMSLAIERLNDAEILLKAHRYDGAFYVCGYAVEIALKHQICQTLNWAGFPSTSKEFDKYRSLKTHDLNALLSFTGIEISLRTVYFAEWSAVSKWNPEVRYNPTGLISSVVATLTINSAKTLVGIL